MNHQDAIITQVPFKLQHQTLSARCNGNTYRKHHAQSQTLPKAKFPKHPSSQPANHPHHGPRSSTTKSIKRTSLPLERIHHVQRRHRLALRMFGVGNRVTDHALEECFQYSARFFVDHWLSSAYIDHGWLEEGVREGLLTGRNTLHTSTASQTPDGRLCDALDVIS